MNASSNDSPVRYFKELADYYNREVPATQATVRDAQAQLDQMKMAQKVVDSFCKEMDAFCRDNPSHAALNSIIVNSGFALLDQAQSGVAPSTEPLRCNPPTPVDAPN